MSIYKKLGLEPIINASGAVTRLGGAHLRPVALEAYVLASQETVPLEQLQAAASQQISKLTGAEAGLVTSGAAAGLTLRSAAILAGLDAGIVARRHIAGLQHRCPVHQELELNLVVAGDAGVGSAALLVFGTEVVDDEGLELLL